MTSNLSKYVARSPRYILQPEDNTLIRLAGPNQVPWEEGTEIVNMSASGLAFTAPADLCPVVGEIVKVQFDVPGSAANGGMAAFAMVVRIDERQKGTMLVGTQFVQMDTSQKLHMAHGLGQKLKSVLRDENEIVVRPPGHYRKAFLYAGLSLVLILLWCGLFFLWYPI